MNISAPVRMLSGAGSGPALLVIGVIAAIWLAQRAAAQTPPAKSAQR